MSGVFHGGDLTQAMDMHGGSEREWLDLSTGINPKSWPVGDIPSVVWRRLPDSGEEALLIAAARRYYQVYEKYAMLCCNGTQTIIQLLPCLFGLECKVDIIQPTYGEHAHCWQREGHIVNAVSKVEDIKSPNVAIVVNPNNPDGKKTDAETLLLLAGRLNKTGGKLVIDEAFGDAFPQLSMAGYGLDNVIVLKSFGKFFGLGGLRLGFAIANENIIKKLREARGPWAVNGPALNIGVKALADKPWIDATRQWISCQADKQGKLLAECGLEVIGNAGLFLQTRHAETLKIYNQLLVHHILTRKFPDQPQFLRFGLCENDDDLGRLKHELERILNG